MFDIKLKNYNSSKQKTLVPIEINESLNIKTVLVFKLFTN